MKFSRTSKRIASAAAALGVVIALAACSGTAATPAGSTGAAPKHANITIGTGGQLSNADILLAQSEGFFKKAGLTAKVQILTAGSNAIPQLLNGSMTFATVDLATAITATAQNIGITAVAPNTVGSPGVKGYAGIIAGKASGVTDLAGLAGKTVAVNQLGGTAETLTKASLKKAGVDPASVKFVEVAPPSFLSTLAKGTVDAIVAGEPLTSIAVATGATLLANPEQTTVPDVPTFVFIASKAYVTANPGIVREFQKAILEGNTFANANPDKVRSTQKTGPTLSPQILAVATLPTFGEKALTASQIQAYLDVLTTYGGLDATKAPKASAVLASLNQ
ncbi:MAG: nitrate transporter substrate-binding protein [Glaciihabitans sp.]|jgi:NitT/TauT family transport system substrate-binding protein|nr:nitrate transporter substrate-binding protein [Glaciihabitans sp.]